MEAAAGRRCNIQEDENVSHHKSLNHNSSHAPDAISTSESVDGVIYRTRDVKGIQYNIPVCTVPYNALKLCTNTHAVILISLTLTLSLPALSSYGSHHSHPSFPLLFSHSTALLLLLPCSLSLPGSLPSVCLWARGAGCYLDDLVREGERDFISCLPEGLWYLWCYKAALLKKKKAFIRLLLSVVSQWVKVHPVHLVTGSSPWSGYSPLGLWYLWRCDYALFMIEDETLKNTRARLRVHCVLWVRALRVGVYPWASGSCGAQTLFLLKKSTLCC